MDLVLTVCIGLLAALVLGYLTQRLGLSPLVGYLLAGVLVSPNTPGLVVNHEITSQLAEVGIVLLMFGVGLHFEPRELVALRRLALPGALVQSVVAAGLGLVAARALGGADGWLGAAVYGMALSVASTVVMTRVLADRDELHTASGRLAVGWTLVEDLLTVVILVLLPAAAPGDSAAGGPVARSLALAFGKIAVLLAVLFLVGSRVVPWVLRRVAATRSRELFTLTVLVAALGI
ncbi:MAG TPA: cation:proton antiporter, partial [Spirochaetia bacterium]|nr:cation:proton antiporter [Spirochaetia bacterium]